MANEKTISEWEYDKLRNAEKDAQKLSSVKSAMKALLDVLKGSLVVLWWVIGAGGTVALWFYPAPANRLQPIVFAAAAIIFALISRALYKVKEIEGRYE